MSTTHSDIVIVGGAIVGSCVAAFLKRDLGYKGTVTVIERDPTYTYSSTTLSAASIRQQFSMPENIRMSQFGIDIIRGLKQRFGTNSDVGFREKGYLLLASSAGDRVLSSNIALQQHEGADIVALNPAALSDRFPWLSVDGIALGAWGRTGEGWFDAHSLLTLFRDDAKSAGVIYLKDEVQTIEYAQNQVNAVQLASGQRITCGALVNAAGPQAGDVAAMLNIRLPVEPRKRSVFVVDCKSPLPDMPLIVDTSGVYIRPEGHVYICGVSPHDGQDPRADGDFEVDYPLFDDVIWPALAERIPALETLKLIRAWAGHYDYNTLDQNAIIGAHPQVSNFYLANGFSGHGLQQAPAAGRAIAELIVTGSYKTIDLSKFSYERVVKNKPMFENNII